MNRRARRRRFDLDEPFHISLSRGVARAAVMAGTVARSGEHLVADLDGEGADEAPKGPV